MTPKFTIKSILVLALLFLASYVGFRYGPQLLILAQSERSGPPSAQSQGEAPLSQEEAQEVMDKRFKGDGLGVVIASALNVRNAPGLRGGKLGVLYCGDVVKLGPAEAGWYPIEVGPLRGYSHGAYLFPIAPGGALPPCGAAGTRQTQKPPSAPTRNPHATASKEDAPGSDVPTAPEPPPAPTTPAEPKADVSVAPKPSSSKKSTSPKATDRGPRELTLATSNRAKSVSFPHHGHNQMFGCAQCHHPLEAQGTQANSEKECRSCHGATAASSVSTFTAKEVMHKTCQGCHQAQAAGPQKCSGCHTGS